MSVAIFPRPHAGKSANFGSKNPHDIAFGAIVFVLFCEV
jgi:hypothetical protein